jgi:PHP family Zn ribbon phosphoesterase
MIKAFRSGRFNIVEGGGGKYGEVVFKDSGPRKFYTGNQSMLDSFVE